MDANDDIKPRLGLSSSEIDVSNEDPERGQLANPGSCSASIPGNSTPDQNQSKKSSQPPGWDEMEMKREQKNLKMLPGLSQEELELDLKVAAALKKKERERKFKEMLAKTDIAIGVMSSPLDMDGPMRFLTNTFALNSAMCEIIPPGTEGMESKDIRATDVLMGRERKHRSHVGNICFRDLVNKYRSLYLESRKKLKPRYSWAIICEIRSKDGRFLRADKKTGLYFEVGDIHARHKVSQLFGSRLKKKQAEIQRGGNGMPNIEQAYGLSFKTDVAVPSSPNLQIWSNNGRFLDKNRETDLNRIRLETARLATASGMPNIAQSRGFVPEVNSFLPYAPSNRSFMGIHSGIGATNGVVDDSYPLATAMASTKNPMGAILRTIPGYHYNRMKLQREMVYNVMGSQCSARHTDVIFKPSGQLMPPLKTVEMGLNLSGGDGISMYPTRTHEHRLSMVDGRTVMPQHNYLNIPDAITATERYFTTRGPPLHGNLTDDVAYGPSPMKKHCQEIQGSRHTTELGKWIP